MSSPFEPRSSSILNRFDPRIISYGAVFLLILFIAYSVGLSLKKPPLSPEEKEKQAIAQGLVKTLGGMVVRVDPARKEFDLDIDYVGNPKIYKIRTNTATDFRWMQVEEEGGSARISQVNLPAFDSLEERIKVIVLFPEPVNPDSSSPLAAKRIYIVYE